MEEEAQKLMTKGNDRVKPMLVPMMISNMAAGNVAIDLGAKGKCINVVTACAHRNPLDWGGIPKHSMW